MWVNTPEGRVEYGRDPQGRLTQVKTSTGIDTVYTYTSRGQIKSISDRGLSSASDATGTVSYGYDEFGRKESITRPNGTTSEYAYDPLTGWTESITHKRGGNVLLALGYDRDKTGLITDIAETRPAGEQSGAWHYGYDTLKRLTAATWTPSAGAATEYDYTYDRNGNRLSESVTGSAAKFSRYNKLDQLLDERTSAAYPGGTIEKSYAWDTHGRLSSESGVGVSPAIDRLYTWSVDDRLESVQLGPNPNDPTVRYTYDHEGRMIKREKGQDVARFLVDNDNPTGYSQALSEVNADATKPTENYYYGDDFGPLAQVHNPGAAGFDQRFLYGDHLSTTRLLDSALASDSYHYYTPFGNQTGPSTPLSAFAFTGQYRDIDSGLQYHRARWLNTGSGGWLSEDPVWDFDGNFGNPHTYLAVMPINSDDVRGTAGDQSIMSMVGSAAMQMGLAGFRMGTAMLAIRLTFAAIRGTKFTWTDAFIAFGSGFVMAIPVLREVFGIYFAVEFVQAAYEGKLDSLDVCELATSIIVLAALRQPIPPFEIKLPGPPTASAPAVMRPAAGPPVIFQKLYAQEGISVNVNLNTAFPSIVFMMQGEKNPTSGPKGTPNLEGAGPGGFRGMDSGEVVQRIPKDWAKHEKPPTPEDPSPGVIYFKQDPKYPGRLDKAPEHIRIMPGGKVNFHVEQGGPYMRWNRGHLKLDGTGTPTTDPGAQHIPLKGNPALGGQGQSGSGGAQ